jgi:hypothetical protein
VIAWVGLKLVWEYLHYRHVVPFAIPKEVGIGMVAVLFIGSFIYARMHERRDGDAVEEAATTLFRPETLGDAPPPAATGEPPIPDEAERGSGERPREKV